MPVTYYFTTIYETPVTEEFGCIDASGAFMPNLPSLPGSIISRGIPWLSFDGEDDMVMKSDDGIATIITISLNISQQFTFETTFKPYKLPTNFEDLSKSRFFIAVFDDEDNAGGILISKSGIAIVSAFGNSVLPIAGSQNIFVEGDEYYTMRMVVDGTINVMDLYITRTVELGITGHVLRYTTGAPVTPATTSDSIRIEVIGQPGALTQGNFDTLRCECNGLVIPNKRPVAVIGDDQIATIGTIVQLDGTASYDPEREEITYFWSVIGVPETSSFKINGTGGFTQDDADGDSVTTFFEATGDPWSAINAPDLQPGGHAHRCGHGCRRTSAGRRVSPRGEGAGVGGRGNEVGRMAAYSM